MKASKMAVYLTASVWIGIGMERASPGGPIPWWVWIAAALTVIATTWLVNWMADRRQRP